MPDKRRDGRISIELPVLLRHGGRIIPATVQNISSSGVYLRVDRSSIVRNRPVEIIFDLNDSARDVSMRGQVIRVEDADDHKGVGIQFTNLFSKSHKTVHEYVTEHLH